MKVDRLISIILILLDKGRIGAHELANLFEVSPRTIYRDMDAINLAGIPVRSTPGAGGGFEILQDFKIDKRVFSTADLSAILMGLSNLPDVMRGDELANALAKVRSFIPADRAKDIELKANQIFVDLSPWMGNGNIQPHSEIIKTAMQERKLVAFEYADRYGNKTVRTAEPYRLVLKGGQWYWQGYCHKRNDFRLFKLSRTSNLEMLARTFSPRDCPKPQLDFPDIAETMRTSVKLRVHASVMDRVLDYCAPDRFSPVEEEHVLVDFPFLENDYYYGILFGFGEKCECVEPPHVRAEVKRRLLAMSAIYER